MAKLCAVRKVYEMKGENCLQADSYITARLIYVLAKATLY